MTSKLSSLLPRDEILRRNIITFDKHVESSDNLSLKSCPAFRPSWTIRKNNVARHKPKWASSSSLSDIREGQPLISELKARKESPDEDLGEDVKCMIENEWKKRIKRKPLNFAELQALARKQREGELKFQRARSKTSSKAESDATLRTKSSSAAKNETSSTGIYKAQQPCESGANKAQANVHAKSRPIGDPVSLSSKSCTIFRAMQNALSHPHSSPARTSKSAHDDVSEPAHVASTPVLGVQELKRRFSVHTKRQKPSESCLKQGPSKLTQTSFTDARISGSHMTPAEVRREQTYQRSWNTRVTEIAITEVAELLAQENELPTNILGQTKTPSTDSIVPGNESVSHEELRAKLAAYFEQQQRCPVVSQTYSEDIIPPPPEFNYESTHQCQPDLAEKPENGEPQDEDLGPVLNEPRQRRPASTKASPLATRSRCTQTRAVRRAGRRRSRRVTYSPSEGSAPSDLSEDQWSARSGRHRHQLSRGSWRRRPAREVTGWEETPVRSGGSRPVSGRSSQVVGSRPVSGRSRRAADRPTLLEEVHRKARSQQQVVTVKRRRSKRKVFKVPKDMPEAISRFLEQLSKDKEAIRVIHKMSLVTNKK